MSTKDFSSVQEKRVADFLNWKVVSGSGSRDFNPGDIEGDNWLGECKTHVSTDKSIVFKKTVWDKVHEEATSKFKTPVLIVDDGSQSIDRTWCMFPASAASSYEFVEYPYSIRSNVIFDHSALMSEYRKLNPSDLPYHKKKYFQLDFHNRKVGIVPLELFYEMFAY